MNQKNLNYEIETQMECTLLTMVMIPMNQKNLNYEIETERDAAQPVFAGYL